MDMDVVIDPSGSTVMRRQRKDERVAPGEVSAHLGEQGEVELQNHEDATVGVSASSYLEISADPEPAVDAKDVNDVAAVENAAIELLVMERKNAAALSEAF